MGYTRSGRNSFLAHWNRSRPRTVRVKCEGSRASEFERVEALGVHDWGVCPVCRFHVRVLKNGLLETHKRVVE